MCVRVCFATSAPAIFDHERKVITLPPGLTPNQTLTAVRAILTKLIVEQPATGAVCFCGEPVDLAGLFPPLRLSEVNTIGA